jgi:hypothetical protein
LIPIFDPAIEKARLVRTDPAEAVSGLMQCYASILGKGEGYLLHFFDLSDALIEERLAVLLGSRLPEVATYEVHQNHRTNEQTARLVAGIL